jgi:hypothetical protein
VHRLALRLSGRREDRVDGSIALDKPCPILTLEQLSSLPEEY